jgi:chemotaxis protein CheD
MRGAAAHKQDGSLRRFLNPQDNCWHVQVTQGDTYVTDNDNEVLTTILGSCIAACIRDPVTRIGGMNHFLLPNGKSGDTGATRFGVNAMEILINNILKRGGARNRLEAKLFGGASVIAGLSDVGASNIVFAEKFLADEHIRLVGGDVRGSNARRIQYWPVTGRARQLSVANLNKASLVEEELATAARSVVVRSEADSDVELF